LSIQQNIISGYENIKLVRYIGMINIGTTVQLQLLQLGTYLCIFVMIFYT